MSGFEDGAWETAKNMDRVWIGLESWGGLQGPLQSGPCLVDCGLDPDIV